MTINELLMKVGHVKKYRAGVKLPANKIHYILNGSVSEGVTLPSFNTDIITRLLHRGSLLNTEIIFTSEPKYTYYCRIDTTVVSIYPSKINEEIFEFIAGDQYLKAQQLLEYIHDKEYLSSEGHILKILLRLQKSDEALSHPNGFQVQITRHDLAMMLGLTREQTGRILTSLHEKRKITVKGKTILVHTM